jgi:hypothetical protein
VSEDVYTERETVVLANPIALEPDALPCDRAGCWSMARWLIPGASLCQECADEFGLGGSDTYSIPLDALVGDSRWRRARRDEYVERLDAYPPLRRDDRHDRLLARLAKSPLDEIFGDA